MKRFVLSIFSLLFLFATCFAAESLSSGEIISVSPSTGQLRYELPLYNISDPDFQWSIGISYTSDGFRPCDYSYPVGSGWELSTGGSITREIIGVADDLDTVTGYFPYSYDIGFLTYARNPNARIFQNCEYTDVGSDIYSFSFGPYAGSFIFDSVGNAKIISGDFIFVDATNVTLQENRAADFERWDSAHFTLLPSCFVLTTLDGYKYYFGSTTSTVALEYGGPFVSQYTPPITEWNLQKIVAPNGASLLFHYHSSCQRRWTYDETFIWRESGYPPSDLTYMESDTLSMELHSKNPSFFLFKSNDVLYRYSILDSITNPQTGLSISFTYNWLRNYVFKNNPTPSAFSLDSVKPFLSSVHVRVGSQTIKSWTLNYTDMSIDTTPRQYLNSIVDNCDNNYSFTYDFSKQISLGVVEDSIDSYGYLLSYPLYGSLISTTNPLGAITDYSYSLARVDSIRIPEYNQGQWRTKTMTYPHLMCHAIRLSDINVTDGTSLLFSKTYSYGEEAGQQNAPPFPGMNGFNLHGSGVLNIEHGYYRNTSPMFGFYTFHNLHATIFPITYSYVKETLKDTDGHITRTTTYKYQTDGFIYGGVQDYNYTSFSKVKDILPYYQTNHWFKLLKIQSEQDATGEIISQKQNDYSGPITNTNLIRYTNKKYWNNIPSSKYHCSHRIETRDQVTSETLSSYDSKFRLVLQSQSLGNDTMFTRMVYPDGLVNNIPNGMSPTDSCYFANILFKEMKIIGEPIEVYGGFVKNGIEQVTHGTLTLKKASVSQGLLPFATITSTAFVLHPVSPITSYTPVHTHNMTMLYNTNYDTVSVARYQRWNRLVWEKRANAALGTSYQWSANQLYPISKTIGNLTWQYTGSPYLGITSETSPSGLIINYQYDNCGRLEEKYILHNNQKEILEHYIYH